MDGTVTHLCIAPGYKQAVVSVDAVEAVEGSGLRGDRYFGTTRQVTVVCTGELDEAAAVLGMDSIPAGSTRRNITVSLPSLPREHGTRIRVGEVELAVWRDCAPCEQMETAVGRGGAPSAATARRRIGHRRHRRHHQPRRPRDHCDSGNPIRGLTPGA